MIKRVLICLVIIILMVSRVKADNMLTNHLVAISKANNYADKFDDSRSFLLFNRNYNYETGSFGDSSMYYNGGLLTASEFNLSVDYDNNSSYLKIGEVYWTLTKNNDNPSYYYCVSNSLISMYDSDYLATRVTEYVKPNIIVKGEGSYSNPWVFKK